MTNFTKNPDYLALLAGIVEHPDDDLRRLVFADWLEEHGDADRAEFIRLQIRESQLEHDDPEREVIGHRTGQLFRTNEVRWLGELSKELRHLPSWSFQRGFLHKLNITATKLLRLPKRFLQRNPITELFLTDLGGKLDRVLDNPHLAHVRSLFLSFEDVPPSRADIKALAECPYLSGVRDLHLCGGGNPLAGAVAKCPSLNGMTDLDLCADIDDDGMATLTTSGEQNLRGLKRLCVRNNRFGVGTAEAIARSSAFAELEHLAIGFNFNRNGQIGDTGASALAASTRLGSLKTLRLDTQGIGPDGVRALAAARHWPHLRALSLFGNQIGVEGARVLAEPHRLRLEALDLSWCELGNDGVAALMSSDGLAKLVALDLEHNALGVESAVVLSRSEVAARLVILNLNKNALGDAGALALCESKTLANLRRLYAEPQWGDYSLDAEAILKRRFPDGVRGHVFHTFWPETILGEVEKA